MTNDTKLQSTELKFAIIAADVVLFTIKDNELCVRLIAVNRPPSYPAGSTGFPGGLIHPNETAEEAAKRILNEKAEIDTKKIYLEQLYTFSEINRDPRGRVVAVSYIGLIPWDNLTQSEQKDSSKSWWAKVDNASGLAYDHDEMLKVAIGRLRSRVRYTTLVSKLMPAEFTLGKLEQAYNEILKKSQDKRNFRKKIAKLNILKELPHKQLGEPFRPAKLYKFRAKDIKEIEII